MIADNKVYALLFGIGNFLDGLNAAVEDNNKFHTNLPGIVYSFLAYAISLVVAVGDIVFDIGIETLQEFIHQCYCRAPVHIVVAIYHDAFFAPHCIV